jgi:DNA mismatch endonuclease (patch repair protein)
MSDVFSKAKRSQVMARIRGRGNRETELALRALLRSHRITGWRRHLPILGRPDFAFLRQRVAVFVDGCFWHQCPRCSNRPVNNREFWVKKLEANVARDRLVTRELRRQGWRVVRIWEHSLRRPKPVIRRILTAIGS